MPKKLLILVAWLMVAIAATAAVVRAVQEKASTLCAGVNVVILGDNSHVFVEEREIYQLINKIGLVRGQQLGRVHLSQMERMLETNPWIYAAELFFDARHHLQVHITEREPIARIFTAGGSSFYIDSSGLRLPLSAKLSARVPVFTGFPSERAILSAPDSLVLRDVQRLAGFINADSFWQAQTAQIDIAPTREYVLVPLVGSHEVWLGKADSLDQKFGRLYSFYKAAWSGGFFEKYETIDLRFSAQVVAIRRGSAPVFADTARAMQSLLSDKLIHSLENGDTTAKVTQYGSHTQPIFDTVAASNALRRKRGSLSANSPAALAPKPVPAKVLGRQPTRTRSAPATVSPANRPSPGPTPQRPIQQHN